MEGLEISEINLSSHLERNENFRLDAEFRTKESLRFETLLFNKGAKTFGECSPEILHPQEIQRNYVEKDEGVWFFRAQNIRPLQIRESNQVYIGLEDAVRLKRNRIQLGDVLMTRTGANAGDCALFKFREEAIGSSHTFIIRQKTYSQSFLAVFLNTRPALKLIFRSRYGGAQPEIAPSYLKQIPILSASSKFQQRITDIVQKADESERSFGDFQKRAEQTLLSALKLKNWQPANPLTYEVRASEAFLADRLDAEFFQPRIKELYQLLGNKSQCISDVSDLRQDRFNGTKNQFNYLEIGAVSSDGLIADSIIDGDDAPSRATWHVERGDVLTSTVRPIRGLTAIIEDSQHGAVASSGFAVLAPKGISPELLLCYLKLPQICELMDLHTSASMYPAISVSDILGLPFKHPGKKAEEEIVSLIQEARAKRAHSKSLLERAKRAVEIAIEESEETALAYLDGKHYLADELLPKLFSPNRHYIDLATVQRTIEAEALVYEDATINRYLHEWTREGRIHDAGRGWYSDLRHAFQPVLETPPLPELEKLLRTKFPLLEFTVWSTRQLTAFFHHYAARHATFLMVDRDAIDTVADVLSKAGHHVAIHPLGDAAKNFALTQDETIILRPRLSSDHKETHAPIEQILVDLHHEIQKLGLFDLAEFQSVFENLASRYRLNIPALKRYAERRKIDSSELLNRGGITC